LNRKIKEIAEGSFLSEPEQRALFLAAWESAVEESDSNGVLSSEVETRLVQLKDELSLPQSDIKYRNTGMPGTKL
jgi:hypothetical protein